MPESQFDVEMMDCSVSSPPIYSPHSPDYSPDSLMISVNQQKIYGEKINSLDRLLCTPVGERNVLIEQLTFRPLNDTNTNDEEVECVDAVGGVCGTNVGVDTESLNDTNVQSVAASIASEDCISVATNFGCGGADSSNDYENKTIGIIIIPSPTVRVYSSFAINRCSIPKLCLFCFRSYCVCAKDSIDGITKTHYDSRNYDFFKNL